MEQQFKKMGCVKFNGLDVLPSRANILLSLELFALTALTLLNTT